MAAVARAVGLLAALAVDQSLAINPGGFPNSISAPLRGWRSWNVRQPSHPWTDAPAAVSWLGPCRRCRAAAGPAAWPIDTPCPLPR